jgi:hypothetical protein
LRKAPERVELVFHQAKAALQAVETFAELCHTQRLSLEPDVVNAKVDRRR